MKLLTTYATERTNPLIARAWSFASGSWFAGGSTPFEVVLAPRLPRTGKDEPLGSLSGFITEGSLQGALHFEGPPPPPTRTRTFADAVRLTGKLIRADFELTELAVELEVASADGRAVLSVGGGPPIELAFAWRGLSELLTSIAVVGHRGLGFEGLGNRPRALAAAWAFGASAIEIDVVVPFQSPEKVLGGGERRVCIEDLVVFHPVGNYDSADIADIPSEFSCAADGFARLAEYGVPLVYVDPKVAWLSPAEKSTAVDKVMDLASRTVSASAGLELTLAAVDRGAADLFSRARFEERVSWTLEWTEVPAPEELVGAPVPPAALSFDLHRIDGSRKWPWLDPFVRNLPRDEERQMASLDQALFFWTANDADHFAGALAAAADPTRMGRRIVPGEIGIFTDHPHRLAAWLARFGTSA